MSKLLFIALALFSLNVHSQYQAVLPSEIPNEIKEGAKAIIQSYRIEVELRSSDQFQMASDRWVTVLNRDGLTALNNFVHYDDTKALKNYSAEVFDARGESIKVIRGGKFLDASAVDGGTLYGDARIKYFEYIPTTYPFTIHFHYEQVSDNTALLPRWVPLDEYGVGVLHSEYLISVPEDMDVRVFERNFEPFGVTASKKGNLWTYELKAAAPMKEEDLSPPLIERIPFLDIAVSPFRLKNLKGTGSDWKSLGKWQYEYLLRGRDQLPEETLSKVRELVSGMGSTREKVRKIYQFVQDNTRYISVQLGIGGWMPISAEEVDRVKYGDCKGLTNYTNALLKSQGIESYYAVIWAGQQKRDLEEEFASMQGNHVILNVPLEEEDIWLECTSQSLPFNYLGSFTDDRLALLLTPEGGVFKKTHQYLDQDNLTTIRARCAINDNGGLIADFAADYEGVDYDFNYVIESLSSEEQEELYRERWSKLTDLRIASKAYQNIKEEARFSEVLQIEARDFAQKNGNELLFRPNALSRNIFVPERSRNRKSEFRISRGYKEVVETELQLPEGYRCAQLPKPVLLTSEFGTYMASVEDLGGGRLLYKRNFLLKHGLYPAIEYAEYRQFRQKVAGYDNLRIAAVKM